jgi:3-oxoacyl-[acyl-carrier-protein] synthase-3
MHMVNGSLHSQILSFAGFLPKKVVFTKDIAPLGSIPRKIDFERLTGIKSHREVGDGECAISLAYEASIKALKRGNIGVRDIDLIINCSVSKLDAECNQMLEPSFASFLAERLGAINADHFDVSNACSGMITALKVADMYIKTGMAKHVLVTSGEYTSPVIYEAQKVSFWLNPRAIPSLSVGDGGGAYLLGVSSNPKMLRFGEPQTLAQYDSYCIADAAIGATGPRMRTRGKALHKAAMKQLIPSFRRVLKTLELDWLEIDHIITHQTSVKVIERGNDVTVDAFGQCKCYHICVDETGNTASTTHAVALEKGLEDNHFNAGEDVLLHSYGSGLSIFIAHFIIPQGVNSWL